VPLFQPFDGLPPTLLQLNGRSFGSHTRNIGKNQQFALTMRRSISVREIAEALSRPIGTVTKQLSRAHERLRAILEEESR